MIHRVARFALFKGMLKTPRVYQINGCQNYVARCRQSFSSMSGNMKEESEYEDSEEIENEDSEEIENEHSVESENEDSDEDEPTENVDTDEEISMITKKYVEAVSQNDFYEKNLEIHLEGEEGKPTAKYFLVDEREEDEDYKKHDLKSKMLSFWHDVPLIPYKGNIPTITKFRRGTVFNYVALAGKAQNLVHIVSKYEFSNPIVPLVKQIPSSTTKSSSKTVLKYSHPSLYNMGFLPQTWRDMSALDNTTGYPMDNDPISIIEISNEGAEIGEIREIRILGSFGILLPTTKLMQWKFVAVDDDDEDFDMIRDLESLDKHLPHEMDKIKKFIMQSSSPFCGRSPFFFFNSKVIGEGQALDVLEEAHVQWRDLLLQEKTEGPNPHNFYTPNTIGNDVKAYQENYEKKKHINDLEDFINENSSEALMKA